MLDHQRLVKGLKLQFLFNTVHVRCHHLSYLEYAALDQTKQKVNETRLSCPVSYICIVAGTRPGFGNLQRIYWRAKPHEAVDAYPETNFVLGHEQWVPKEWVLKVPTVESTCLRSEKINFVEFGDMEHRLKP